MSDTFISKIHINEVRHIHDFEIPISETERKHLIITGKNGSGKTSMLLALKNMLNFVLNGEFFKIAQYKHLLDFSNNKLLQQQDTNPINIGATNQTKEAILRYENLLAQFKNLTPNFVNIQGLSEKIEQKQFLIKYFDAKRNAEPKKPTGISKVTLKGQYGIEENANIDFLQYIVNMKADRSFARDEGKLNEAQAIDTWFTNFENRLKSIFNAPSLKLEFERKNYNYNFKIIEEGKEPYDFTTLSDGYSAVMSIVSELILRMEGQSSKAYDIEGVVLIDEIETHLHVDLQKKILPFLTDFFPKVQFIVTTHSPFVINSISNAVVCDLEKRIVTEDLSAYSYEAVIESYFGSDMYSEEVKAKLNRFEILSQKAAINNGEATELNKLEIYFDALPKFLSKELQVKIQEIQLNLLTKTNM